MKREIKFNSFYSSSNYTKNLEKLFADYELFRQKHFSQACIDSLEKIYTESHLLLTHSATASLEMIALALDIQAGDEIILPSYTFVSTANAFALRGAKLIFVDIELDTLSIDPQEVEKAVTPATKAIVAVHYAGRACQIDRLKEIAAKNKIYLIEDAAMSFGASHRGKALGTFGDFAVVSFDITKHISATQGGLLISNNESFNEKLSSIYHTGTNRDAFEKGNVPYYEWVGLGSKYQMPESNAAILYTQLNESTSILHRLSELSKLYHAQLSSIGKNKVFQPISSRHQANNYHQVYLMCQTIELRTKLIAYLKEKGIESMFHYIPLHNAQFGRQMTSRGSMDNTQIVSECLLRLPLHFGLSDEDVSFVCSQIANFVRND